MRTYYIFFFLIIVKYSAIAQEYSSYEQPFQSNLYSETLKDSVNLEIILPRGIKNNTDIEYPIIYLLDKQNQNNYKYNLNTIDYLTSLQWMPEAIIVGITFPWNKRNTWTNPNILGGKADDFIIFLEKELNNELKSNYPISNFNLLIGHSRTAIFSSYALSKSPVFFNGVIASSVSNFDFGDKQQQTQFEFFLNKIPSIPQKYYYYFSVGEQLYGDLHETAVDALNSYLISKDLPKNLEWKYYKYKVAHNLTPGLTISRALSEIFKDYGKRINICFNLAKASKNKVPWDDFQELYSSLSSKLGFEILPSKLFFNSIASEYYNDYDNIYGTKKLDFTLEVLVKAIEKYPKDFSYFSWIGETYMTRKDYEKGLQFLNRSIELINNDKTISISDRISYIEEIEALKKIK
ncbi:MAG: hypothetical protein HRU49_13020 [Winogradskyella sp.]|uniref:alpha/beta hydrolase-fold protein n=1 Tax=Winogradskyella sp. TaxID=1883156 RepID=UPI0025F637BD|nr:alpha/beta hydrolase-fold protein [Winogradskyella sp.]NRB84669.1 hypothetical protein [Winogradskyella sp.]